MTKYQDNGIFIIKDGSAQIPRSLDNGDYLDYLNWLSEGNTVEIITPLEPYVPSEKDVALNRLIELDRLLPRSVEDLYVDLGKVPFNTVVWDEKIALREKLKGL